MQTAGLYIHIPFCLRKCLYCDFLSFTDCIQDAPAYFKSLCRELETRGKPQRDLLFDSIFIGGGTPSCVEPSLIGQILDKARNVLSFVPDPEITIEVNPGTLQEEALARYQSYGINRISMGIQSVSNRLLRSIGRIHDRAAAKGSAALLRSAGFTNYNFDFITGIPGICGEAPESLAEALDDVSFALQAQAQHISIYSMITEPGTPLEKLNAQGRVQVCDEDQERRMYHTMRKQLLDAGFCHYEISNFARPGCECRHNLKYWNCAPYLGIGLGSASYLPGGGDRYIRSRNTSDWQHYLTSPEFCDEETEFLSVSEQRDEFMMLGFRLLKGPDPALYRMRFGRDLCVDYGAVLKSLEHRNLIYEDLSLSERGLDYGNEIFREFV